jgi:hypothetical protein
MLESFPVEPIECNAQRHGIGSMDHKDRESISDSVSEIHFISLRDSGDDSGESPLYARIDQL